MKRTTAWVLRRLDLAYRKNFNSILENGSWKKHLSDTAADQSFDLNPSKKTKVRITRPVKPLPESPKPTIKSKRHPQKKTSTADLLELEQQWRSPRKSVKNNRQIGQKTKVKGEILYGKFPVLIALQAKHRDVHKVLIKSSHCQSFDENNLQGPVADIITIALEQKIPIEAVDNKYLSQLVEDPLQGFRQHQGVCADVSPLDYSVLDLEGYGSELSHSQHLLPRLWLLTQSVQDPNNLGAILRSAFYLGVDRVLTNNSCKLSPAVSKVSAGAVELMDVRCVPDTSEFIHVLRKHDWQILGTTGSSNDLLPTPLSEINMSKNTVLVLGNEGEGLSDDVTTLCDRLVIIPKFQVPPTEGKIVDSLNVSVATGIILYDLIQKRRWSS